MRHAFHEEIKHDRDHVRYDLYFYFAFEIEEPYYDLGGKRAIFDLPVEAVERCAGIINNGNDIFDVDYSKTAYGKYLQSSRKDDILPILAAKAFQLTIPLVAIVNYNLCSPDKKLFENRSTVLSPFFEISSAKTDVFQFPDNFDVIFFHTGLLELDKRPRRILLIDHVSWTLPPPFMLQFTLEDIRYTYWYNLPNVIRDSKILKISNEQWVDAMSMLKFCRANFFNIEYDQRILCFFALTNIINSKPTILEFLRKYDTAVVTYFGYNGFEVKRYLGHTDHCLRGCELPPGRYGGLVRAFHYGYHADLDLFILLPRRHSSFNMNMSTNAIIKQDFLSYERANLWHLFWLARNYVVKQSGFISIDDDLIRGIQAMLDLQKQGRNGEAQSRYRSVCKGLSVEVLQSYKMLSVSGHLSRAVILSYLSGYTPEPTFDALHDNLTSGNSNHSPLEYMNDKVWHSRKELVMGLEAVIYMATNMLPELDAVRPIINFFMDELNKLKSNRVVMRKRGHEWHEVSDKLKFIDKLVIKRT